MAECSISDKRYTYIHDSKWPSEAADVHHIVVRKSGAKGFLVYLSALLILANGFHLFLVKVCSCFFFYLLLGSWNNITSSSQHVISRVLVLYCISLVFKNMSSLVLFGICHDSSSYHIILFMNLFLSNLFHVNSQPLLECLGNYSDFL
jgi:hypothetical protein